MGNTIMVRRKKAKVMKIDGDIFRLKTPATVSDATKEYPGYVLLDSETVKLLGVRAKPLEPSQILKPNKTYFLVELPAKVAAEEGDTRNKLPYRRVMSGIHVGAKERLEMLMLTRRTVSDITVARYDGGDGPGLGPGQVRVRLRLPRSQITKFMEETNDDASAVAERIVALYLESSGKVQGGDDSHDFRRRLDLKKAREKHVSFAEKGGRGEIVVL
ncbi:unnamed protein product [Thlaspi arvense]|uniref:Plastid movement impaired protein n=1 Tax=Thlaspi arvense TaxID=13288 RepID=A0AAU9T952_THLAR|nr:unnamed protein product [Thlaspi arvense]